MTGEVRLAPAALLHKAGAAPDLDVLREGGRGSWLRR
jgi:hypothetical protein